MKNFGSTVYHCICVFFIMSSNSITLMTSLNFTDVIVEFDPVEYGPVVEGPLRSVSFRIVARAPPVRPITVLFSTRSQTALGMAVYKKKY